MDDLDGEADAKAASADIEDVKSPSKEDGAVNDDAGDAKEGAVADSKGEPVEEDDVKAGAKDDATAEEK